MTAVEIHGARVLICDPDGGVLHDGGDALGVISEAMRLGADMVAVPVQRLPDDFFRLGSGVAGDIVQKFVTYRLRLAVVGDVSGHVARSGALRDFVSESNRGRHTWFVTDREALETRLARASQGHASGTSDGQRQPAQRSSLSR